MTGPLTVSGQDLNPGPLSLEESALPTELPRPDIPLIVQHHLHNINGVMLYDQVKLNGTECTRMYLV